MIEVLLATPDVPREADLVAAASGAGVRVLRRCIDAADLLAAASADPSAAVVVSAGLPRLSVDIVQRLGGRVVGLAAGAADDLVLRGLGVDDVLPTAASAEATMRALRDRCANGAPGHAVAGVWPTDAAPQTSTAEPAGRLVAVWGPMGAPGRTTVATWLSEAVARDGLSTLVVDADTYAPSLGLALGVVPESGGLLGAVRQADAGLLTTSALTSLARRVRGSWHILGGLPRVDCWPELHATGLDRLWETCRSAFDVTVVDVGFCLESDDSPAAWSRQRNAAALSAIAAADHVVVVGEGSPAGAARLAVAWAADRERLAGLPVTLVRNRARRGGRSWAEVLRAGGLDAPIVAVPADPRPAALAKALRDLVCRSVPR